MIKKLQEDTLLKKNQKHFLFYIVFPLYNELHVFSKNCNRSEMVRWH